MTDAEGWHDSGNWYQSGFSSYHTMEWSDPRLPAEMVGLLSGGGFGDGEDRPGQIVQGQVLLEGPDGFWNGPMRVFYDEDSVGHGWMTLTGHGTYENLSAWFTSTTDPSCAECLSLRGAIFEGAMPTMTEPLEPPVE